MILTDTTTQTIDWSGDLSFTPDFCPNKPIVIIPDELGSDVVVFNSDTKILTIKPASDFALLGSESETKSY